jgi:gliding motility-associated-like protein
VHGLPNLNFPALGTVCENQELMNLEATPAGGQYSGSGVSGTIFNPGDPLVQRDTITTFTYEYKDQWNCENAITSNVTVLTIPKVNIAIDDGLICEDSSALLSIIDFNPLYDYDWYKGGQLVQKNGRTILVDQNGVYQATVDFQGCASESNKQEVVVYSMSIEAGGPYTVKLGNNVSFIPDYAVTPSTSIPSFTYDFTPGGNALGTNIRFNFTPDTDSILVHVRMMNELGCYIEDDFMIYVYRPIQVPEIITPNYDGKNDQWVINNITDYPKSTVKVFNRWGNIVFEAENYQNDWEGIRNGESLPVATYYYIIELNTEDDEKPYSGSLTIMR